MDDKQTTETSSQQQQQQQYTPSAGETAAQESYLKRIQASEQGDIDLNKQIGGVVGRDT